MLAILIISLFLLFYRKKQTAYVELTKEQKQDLIDRCDAIIEANLNKQKLEAVQKAQEAFLKVQPILTEIKLDALVREYKKGNITEQELAEYSDKLLDLRNKLQNENVVNHYHNGKKD